ncbi:MAG: chain-length determining protein [Prevotella sp.]|nr:chain-length determining protein [Prevotella sp.]MBQ9561475.1 chain-length determining protein [Prevotella sp.]
MSEEKKIVNISLVDVIDIVRKDWKKIAIYSFVAGVIGVALAFATPHKYKSTVMLAPEESGQGFSGSLSSLASMVGMNMKLGQTGDALYPEIYPDLVSSTDFVIDLFPVQVTTKKGDLTCDYYTYLVKHQKLALTDYPKAGLVLLIEKFREHEPNKKLGGKHEGPIALSKEQDDVAKAISANVACGVDKKTNVITITVTDQDPLIAATMADTIKQHLQKAITEYRTKKAKVDLDYMQKLYVEAKNNYDKARQKYAYYADTNMDVELQSYKSKEEDLENEMQLKYNIYQTVVEQLQLAKAKVQERTPAFTVMQSATVPVKHSDRPKVVTLAIWMILGFMVRFAMLAWKNKDKFVNLA